MQPRLIPGLLVAAVAAWSGPLVAQARPAPDAPQQQAEKNQAQAAKQAAKRAALVQEAVRQSARAAELTEAGELTAAQAAAQAAAQTLERIHAMDAATQRVERDLQRLEQEEQRLELRQQRAEAAKQRLEVELRAAEKAHQRLRVRVDEAHEHVDARDHADAHDHSDAHDHADEEAHAIEEMRLRVHKLHGALQQHGGDAQFLMIAPRVDSESMELEIEAEVLKGLGKGQVLEWTEKSFPNSVRIEVEKLAQLGELEHVGALGKLADPRYLGEIQRLKDLGEDFEFAWRTAPGCDCACEHDCATEGSCAACADCEHEHHEAQVWTGKAPEHREIVIDGSGHGEITIHGGNGTQTIIINGRVLKPGDAPRPDKEQRFKFWTLPGPQAPAPPKPPVPPQAPAPPKPPKLEGARGLFLAPQPVEPGEGPQAPRLRLRAEDASADPARPGSKMKIQDARQLIEEMRREMESLRQELHDLRRHMKDDPLVRSRRLDDEAERAYARELERYQRRLATLGSKR